MKPYHEETKEFPVSSGVLFDAVVAAVGRFPKMAIRLAEPSIGAIAIVKAMGARSAGEFLLLRIAEEGASRSTVRIWSESFGFYDPLLVNRSNVRRLLDEIAERVAAASAELRTSAG